MKPPAYPKPPTTVPVLALVMACVAGAIVWLTVASVIVLWLWPA